MRFARNPGLAGVMQREGVLTMSAWHAQDRTRPKKHAGSAALDGQPQQGGLVVEEMQDAASRAQGNEPVPDLEDLACDRRFVGAVAESQLDGVRAVARAIEPAPRVDVLETDEPAWVVRVGHRER